jgi:branched-chain amino acid transport system substrate-binding protein
MPSASETVDLCPLFSSLGAKDRAKIAAEMRERRYDAGGTMTSEDQGGVAFFVIAEGEATVSVAGRGAVKRLGPGDYFGEMALITGHTRSAAIVADTDVQCWALSQWHFKPTVVEHPEVAWALLEVLAQRVAETQVGAPGDA